MPAGTYVCRIVSGELGTSKANATPGYKLTFRVLEGEHAGRQVWCDVWLTDAALPMAKRDLAKLGIIEPDQLERPLPKGVGEFVKVALRKSDAGAEFNAVKSFDVLGIDPPDVDPFAAPDADPLAGAGVPNSPPPKSPAGCVAAEAPAVPF